MRSKMRQLFGPIGNHITPQLLKKHIGRFVIFRGDVVIVSADSYKHAKEKALKLVPPQFEPHFYFATRGYPIIYYIPPRGPPEIARYDNVVYRKVDSKK